VNSGVLHVVPVLVVLGLIYLIYSRTGDRPPTYTLSESWTYAPILWAATEEVVSGGGHHDDQKRGHENIVNAGGGVSGRW